MAGRRLRQSELTAFMGGARKASMEAATVPRDAAIRKYGVGATAIFGRELVDE